MSQLDWDNAVLGAREWRERAEAAEAERDDWAETCGVRLARRLGGCYPRCSGRTPTEETNDE